LVENAPALNRDLTSSVNSYLGQGMKLCAGYPRPALRSSLAEGDRPFRLSSW